MGAYVRWTGWLKQYAQNAYVNCDSAFPSSLKVQSRIASKMFLNHSESRVYLREADKPFDRVGVRKMRQVDVHCRFSVRLGVFGRIFLSTSVSNDLIYIFTKMYSSI